MAIRLIRQFQQMVVWGRSVLPGEDKTLQTQILQIETDDGLQEDVSHLQTYGLASAPPKGSLCLVLEPNADSDSAVALNPDHAESRPKDLAEGDTVLYSKGGAKIHLHPDGCITITAEQITINADSVSLAGLSIENGQLMFNGKKVALQGDAVSTPAGPGTIT